MRSLCCICTSQHAAYEPAYLAHIHAEPALWLHIHTYLHILHIVQGHVSDHIGSACGLVSSQPAESQWSQHLPKEHAHPIRNTFQKGSWALKVDHEDLIYHMTDTLGFKLRDWYPAGESAISSCGAYVVSGL